MTARGDLVVDLLLGRTDGMSSKQICRVLGLTVNQVGDALRSARENGRVDRVYLANGGVVWLLTAPAAALREQLRKASYATALASQRRRRQTAREQRAPDNIITYEVRDLPVVQRRVTNWAPVQAPPGPTSVFNFGAQNA